jgi:predicted transposase YbfD/YdcC
MRQGFLKVGKKGPSSGILLVVEAEKKAKEVEMKCNTGEEQVFDVGSLYAKFCQLSDKRKPKGLRYELATILLVMALAKICGEDSPSGIAEWAKHRTELLCEALKLERKTMPHHSTYRRISADVICVEELEQMLSEMWSDKRFFGRQVLLAMDGKVLRGTLDEEQKGVYLLAAYLPAEGVVLMEMEVSGKGSEIPTAPKLLKSIDLREKVVMGDALHTQRNVSIQIVEAGGDYIWLAKGNQPQIEEDIRLWFEPDPTPMPGQSYIPKDFETTQTVSKGHGRLEERTLIVSSQLQDFLDWPYLKQVFKLERRFTFLKTGRVQTQVVYGLTSLSRDNMAPSQLLTLIRSYWGIENGLHYRRDVTLHEDQTRMTKPQTGRVMACLNNLVLGLLIGKHKFRYLPSARRYFAAFPSQALALLTRL